MQDKIENKIDAYYIFHKYPETRKFFVKNQIFGVINKKSQNYIDYKNSDFTDLENLKFGVLGDYEVTIISIPCKIIDTRVKNDRYGNRHFYYLLFEKILNEKLQDFTQKIDEVNIKPFLKEVFKEYLANFRFDNFNFNNFISIYKN